MGVKINSALRILGILSLVLAASMTIPFLLAVYYGESSLIKAFLLVIGICIFWGILIRITIKPSHKKLKTRDGFFVVSLSWFFCSLLGCLPFIFSGVLPNFFDAFFETSSGFTTTGSTILSNIEILPKSLLFWRSFTHWLGGMGIIVIVMALLPALGINGQIAAYAETPGPTKDKITAKFTDTAKILYGIYASLTLAQVVLLKIGGMSLYDAFIHAFGSMGTGGFSNYNDSVGHFQSPFIQIVIIIFMIIAGTNFNLFFLARKKGIGVIFHDEEVKFYLSTISIASLLIFIYNAFYYDFEDLGKTLLDSVFQTTSIITTTGFATTDFNLWPTFPKMVLLCLFFIGACSSSTAGGIKCIRILVCLKLLRRNVSLKIHPNRIAPVTVNNSELSTDVVIKITNFIFLYVAVIFSGTLLISINGFDFITTFSAVATCVGNIGPGFNLLGPMENFSILSNFSKFVCSILMIVGRLELFTVIILFSGCYWNSNKSK